MAFDHAWIFPVLTATCALAAFFIGYAIGVSNGDEYAWLSYISDGGAIPPQSCIFGQLLNLSAVFSVSCLFFSLTRGVFSGDHHLPSIPPIHRLLRPPPQRRLQTMATS
ncbi:hypothetical protein L596_004111 [Steinernema carpocapsae]|uniref:CWH43-like N-terminal domain-containing protein n=1 Tax=Steinernema carpocapsae TaxID=34508 RepID=A0A4U8UUN9_STECR|nr:hypothetical protein L596_004111 [Steinernema carpocapsae]